MLNRFNRASCSPRAFFALLVFVMIYNRCDAQVIAVEETFRGSGEFETVGVSLEGMDNPGWRYSGSGSLTPEGYKFSDRGIGGAEGVNIHQFSRDIIGAGSFVSRLELTDLDLDGITNSTSPTAFASLSFSLGHSSSKGNTVIRVGLRDDTRVSQDEYLITAYVLGDPGVNTAEIGDIVPRGSNVSIEIAFSEPDDAVRVKYDADTETDEIDWIQSFHYMPGSLNAAGMSIRVVQGDEGETDGTIERWSLSSMVFGDFSGDALLDIADIDLLVAAISAGNHETSFDLTEDGIVDATDLAFWIHDVRKTYFGDANVDGEFNSRDFVSVFQAAEYEDDIEGNSSWRTGDWNLDGDFTSSDFVFAFQDGGYEKGPVEVVPEPSFSLLLLLPLLIGLRRPRLG